MQQLMFLIRSFQCLEKAILLTKKRLYKLWDQKNLIHIYCAKQTANGNLFQSNMRNFFEKTHSLLSI